MWELQVLTASILCVHGVSKTREMHNRLSGQLMHSPAKAKAQISGCTTHTRGTPYEDHFVLQWPKIRNFALCCVKILTAGFIKGNQTKILQGKCGELKLDSGKYDLVRQCIVGQIYDSSPVDFISELGASFAVHPTVLNVSHPPKMLRWAAQATAWTLDALFLKRWEDQRAEFWQTLYSTVNTGPILLLCSEDDDLAPFQTICNFASHLRELGGNVKLVAWKSSTHVGHYQHYPKEYKDAVQELLATAASLYSERMKSLCEQELIGRHLCCKTSKPICGAGEGTINFSKNLQRVASREIDGQEENLMQIQDHSSPNVHLFLDNIILDIGMPKDIEDWEIEPFSSSPDVIGQTVGVPGASVSVKPARSIHRCRL